MKTAEGIGAWHNQYSTRPLDQCAERAKRARLDFVIVKYGEPAAERAYAAAGVPWATEVYAYIGRPEFEADSLVRAVDAGACFAVINAEEGPGGWGPDVDTGPAMDRIIDVFRSCHRHVGLYACLDTRGGRLAHPYQQVALARCDGILPMIYPAAFYPSLWPGYIAQAFQDCLGGKGFGGKPVYPVLQSYGGGLGHSGILEQVDLAERYGVADGYSFYTIHNAADEEWDAVCTLKSEPKPEPDPLTAKEKCELAIYRGSKPLIHLATDGEWGKLHAKLHEMKVEPV